MNSTRTEDESEEDSGSGSESNIATNNVAPNESLNTLNAILNLQKPKLQQEQQQIHSNIGPFGNPPVPGLLASTPSTQIDPSQLLLQQLTHASKIATIKVLY